MKILQLFDQIDAKITLCKQNRKNGSFVYDGRTYSINTLMKVCAFWAYNPILAIIFIKLLNIHHLINQIMFLIVFFIVLPLMSFEYSCRNNRNN